jgi:hypothetical protein
MSYGPTKYVKWIFKETGCKGVDWVQRPQDGSSDNLVNTVMKL